MADPTPTSDLATIAGWLREAQSIVILTGAGMSTESGIPDFRGPQGVWTKDPEAEKRAHISHWLSDSEVRSTGWKRRTESPLFAAEPNPGHYALAALEHRAKLDLLVTQNVDGLHHAAGSDPERIVEIHGNVREFMCMNCPDRGPIERVLARVREGDTDPACRSCGGVLKTATISFGQGLVPEDLYRSQAAASQSDLFLAIGTSLVVYPVAEIPGMALRNGARLIIVTGEETPYDHHASAVLREPIGKVLPAVVELV